MGTTSRTDVMNGTTIDMEAARAAFEQAEEGVVLDDERRVGEAGVMLLCSRGGSAKAPRFKPRTCPENISRILEGDPRLSGLWAWDEMAHRRVITRQAPWEIRAATYPRPERDDDYASLACLINRDYGLGTDRALYPGVADAARKHEVNALRDYLESRRGAWDGTPRIDTMLHDVLGVADDTDDEGRSYVATATLLWLRGAIHRALDGGNVKFDCMLILAGPQGCGKTTFFSRLAHRPEWLCENLEDIGDDAACFEQTSDRWIVCLDELVAMRKLKESTKLKNYISREFDQYRAPYARVRETYSRHFVFCGTTNEDEFLTDPTGARRFLVATCGVTTPTISMWDDDFGAYIDQVWSEALARDEDIVRRDGRLELCLPEWAVEAQARDNEGRREDDGSRGMYEAFLAWAAEHGEMVSPARVIIESMDMRPQDLTRAPHKSRMLQEVAAILKASADWEPVGRAVVAGEHWKTGEAISYGRQRAYRPARRAAARLGQPLWRSDNGFCSHDEVPRLGQPLWQSDNGFCGCDDDRPLDMAQVPMMP